MKIRNLMGIELTLDSGEVLTLERIGKGQFHNVYCDLSGQWVYSISIERDAGTDYSKEILSKCDSNPHIPVVDNLGYLEGSDRRVYRMPKYQPLLASNRTAWEQFRLLERTKNTVWSEVYREFVMSGHMRVSDIGNMTNTRITLSLKESEHRTLWLALDELTSTASMYGTSYCMEFQKRNCMVDGDGTLILLDCLFDLETVQRIQTEREKKYSNRY